MSNTGIIVLTAPSGAGKSTLAKRLLAEFSILTFSVSATTRQPRPGEIDGREYLFLSPEVFDQHAKNGDFLEHESFYNGIRYGTLKNQVEKVLNSGYFCLLDVDVHGALNVKKQFENRALAVFIAPPSFSVLEQRLRNRATESENALKMRLERAKHELTFMDSFDECVLNEDLETAYLQLKQIIQHFIETCQHVPSTSKK